MGLVMGPSLVGSAVALRTSSDTRGVPGSRRRRGPRPVPPVLGAESGRLAVRFGADAVLPGFLVFFAALLAISVIDLDHFVIPNRILYPALVASVPLVLLAALANHDGRSLREAAIGCALAWVILRVIHFVSPRGMGYGDVRLSALIGLWLGWITLPHVLLGLFLSFLLASVIGITLIVTRIRSRK